MSDESKTGLQELQHYQVRTHDLLMVVVNSEISDADQTLIDEVLEEFTEEADVYVITVRDTFFKDFKKMSLEELVHLQKVIEEAITRISARDAVGDA